MKPFPEPKVYVPSAIGRDEIVTRKSFLRDLRSAGICDGDLLCVHASCSRIGYVIGGPRTVLDTLIAAVSPSGTLMMPTFSGDMSDPSSWLYPSIPQDLVEEARDSLSGYDPLLTPSKSMGSLAELLRQRPGAVRSPHPQSSFTALGPKAGELCGKHPLDYRFGPDSPLGSLATMNGKVLLLGAPWNTVSLFYLTEYSMADRAECEKSAPLATEDGTNWVVYKDLKYRNEWQEAVVHLLEKGLARRLQLGKADSVLFDAAPAINEIAKWRNEKC